jgi:hypothetical protein
MCLDGTWNSTYAKSIREDGTSVAKPSNVLKLARGVHPVAKDGTTQIVYYDAGIGGDVDSEGSWKLFTKIRKTKEGMWGLGFNANVEQAVTFLANNYDPGTKDDIYFYGFSRGAATARAIVKFIDWMGGLPSKRDAFYIPELFEAYRKSKAKKTCQQAKEERGLFIGKGGTKRPRFEPFNPVTIKMLGVWDTVYSLGGQVFSIANGGFHVDKNPPSIVENAYHALAADEARGAFAPSIWQDKLDHQTMVQMWFPGVHSNVGGGYPRDGLANIPLQWMIKLSEHHGLEFDLDYLGHYRPFASDRLYNSKSLGYKIIDEVLSKESGRNFLSLPDTVCQEFHPSILARMTSTLSDLNLKGKDKSRTYQTGLYRPKAIKKMLSKLSDNQLGYCQSWSQAPWFHDGTGNLSDQQKTRLVKLVKELST